MRCHAVTVFTMCQLAATESEHYFQSNNNTDVIRLPQTAFQQHTAPLWCVLYAACNTAPAMRSLVALRMPPPSCCKSGANSADQFRSSCRPSVTMERCMQPAQHRHQSLA